MLDVDLLTPADHADLADWFACRPLCAKAVVHDALANATIRGLLLPFLVGPCTGGLRHEQSSRSSALTCRASTRTLHWRVLSIPIAGLDISAWLTATQLRKVTTDGSDMAVLSLFEAAELAATSRVDVWRAIQEGALPAQKTSDGGYAIDPTDLFRVFERKQPEPRLILRN